MFRPKPPRVAMVAVLQCMFEAPACDSCLVFLEDCGVFSLFFLSFLLGLATLHDTIQACYLEILGMHMVYCKYEAAMPHYHSTVDIHRVEAWACDQ